MVAPLHAARPAIAAAPEQRQGFAAVLRRRDFRYLWGAQLASQLADKFLMFTLLVFMYTLTRRASLQSVLMIAYTLPSVLLSAPAGVYADRHDKRALMVGTNVVRGALILLIPLAQLIPVLRGQAWPLIVITLLFSSAGQIFAPAEAASIPTLVNRQQITEATSLFMTTVILTLVLGVPAATIAIGFFGNQAPFYIATGLFGLAALSVWKVSVSLRAEQGRQRTGDRTFFANCATASTSCAGAHRCVSASTSSTLAIVVVFTIFALGPVYLVEVLNRSDTETYIVLVPAMFGLIGTAALLAPAPEFPARQNAGRGDQRRRPVAADHGHRAGCAPHPRSSGVDGPARGCRWSAVRVRAGRDAHPRLHGAAGANRHRKPWSDLRRHLHGDQCGGGDSAAARRCDL